MGKTLAKLQFSRPYKIAYKAHNFFTFKISSRIIAKYRSFTSQIEGHKKCVKHYCGEYIGGNILRSLLASSPLFILSVFFVNPWIECSSDYWAGVLRPGKLAVYSETWSFYREVVKFVLSIRSCQERVSFYKTGLLNLDLLDFRFWS